LVEGIASTAPGQRGHRVDGADHRYRVTRDLPHRGLHSQGEEFGNTPCTYHGAGVGLSLMRARPA